MRLFGTDLILLHPPSVYDFRDAGAEYGPISDVIFSTRLSEYSFNESDSFGVT